MPMPPRPPKPGPFHLDPKIIEALELRELNTFSDPETPPTTGVFGAVPGSSADMTGHGPAKGSPWSPDEQRLIGEWKKTHIVNGKINDDRLTKHRFHPYLLVRSMPGDSGQRPLGAGTNVSMSCDIWTIPGTPDTIAQPAWSQSSLAYTDAPVTLCTHVWNLGLAPIVGARVEFWEAARGANSNTPPTRLIGVTRVDLPGRYSRSCHRIVKCPQAYQAAPQSSPVIYVRVRSFADAAPDGMWDPAQDRHIAHRILKAEPWGLTH